MTRKNWYWIVLVVAVCAIYSASCAPGGERADSGGRFTILDDLIADIRDDDGQWFIERLSP